MKSITLESKSKKDQSFCLGHLLKKKQITEEINISFECIGCAADHLAEKLLYCNQRFFPLLSSLVKSSRKSS